MLIADVHAHMDFPDFENDFPEMIKVNKSAGVAAIISNGTTIESNRKIIELAKKYDIIKPALGIYPVHCAEMQAEAIDEEIKFISRQDPVAIGEVGLDYLKGDDNHHGDERKKHMKESFQKFIDLAAKKKIPVIVHSRQAELDCIEMLESSSSKKIVMHCFMGRKHLAKRILDNGWNLSIPCIVTKLQQLQDNVELASSSQLLTETDAPYLSPDLEVKRNEPRFIESSIRKIAQIKKLEVEDTANILYMNYRRLFNA